VCARARARAYACNVKKDQCSNKTDISHHCREEDLEICAVEQETKTCGIIILSLCRAPSQDFIQFLRVLNATLKYLYNPKSKFLICGDIDVHYLNENN
jgi:hypothetical protein